MACTGQWRPPRLRVRVVSGHRPTLGCDTLRSGAACQWPGGTRTQLQVERPIITDDGDDTASLSKGTWTSSAGWLAQAADARAPTGRHSEFQPQAGGTSSHGWFGKSPSGPGCAHEAASVRLGGHCRNLKKTRKRFRTFCRPDSECTRLPSQAGTWKRSESSRLGRSATMWSTAADQD
jgi:hypothetical protein